MCRGGPVTYKHHYRHFIDYKNFSTFCYALFYLTISLYLLHFFNISLYTIYMGYIPQDGYFQNECHFFQNFGSMQLPQYKSKCFQKKLWLTITPWRHSRAKESQGNSINRDEEYEEKISFKRYKTPPNMEHCSSFSPHPPHSFLWTYIDFLWLQSGAMG